MILRRSNVRDNRPEVLEVLQEVPLRPRRAGDELRERKNQDDPRERERIEVGAPQAIESAQELFVQKSTTPQAGPYWMGVPNPW